MSGAAGDADSVTLGGRYRLETRIAVGGMGEVWQAVDVLLHRTVAIKVLKAEYLQDPGFLARFRAEARHTAGLSHPGIATVYDYGESGGAPYLVMELIRGEPLSALLDRAGALPTAQALEIAAQTARALSAAHAAGVVHRDVKPGNILITPDGTVKVTDFGIARAVDAVPLTQTGTVMGTANYLSPEQASGTPTAPASDIYSLGVVTYEMLAGRRPFPAANPVAVALAHVRDAPAALPDDVPLPAQDVVMRALQKQPADRYPDANSFAAAAEHAAAVVAGSLPAGPLADSVQPAGAASAANAPGGSATTTLPLQTVGARALGNDDRPDGYRPNGNAPGGRRRPPVLAVRWLALGAVPVLLLSALLRGGGGGASGTSKRPTAAAGSAGTASSAVLQPTPGVAQSTAAATQSATPPPSATPPSRSASASPAAAAAASRPTPVVVPDGLVGLSYEQAAATVRAAGLQPARRQTASNRPVDTVVGTDPGAGARLVSSATVTLVTSAGPPAPAAPKPSAPRSPTAPTTSAPQTTAPEPPAASQPAPAQPAPSRPATQVDPPAPAPAPKPDSKPDSKPDPKPDKGKGGGKKKGGG